MHTGSYINGTWFHPASTEVTRNINPADTSDVIAEFPLATAADVGRAIEAATAAWPAWKKTPGPEMKPTSSVLARLHTLQGKEDGE